MNKKTWTESEMETLARALIAAYPERHLEAATRPYDVVLTDPEFTPVLQASLPVERHGLRPRLSRLKRDLVKALCGLGKAGALAAEGGTDKEHSGNKPVGSKVRWSNDEWRFCALALSTLCPELNLVHAHDLSGITLHKLNLAASMMEQGRQRTFKRLGGAVGQLAQVYAAARKTRDPFYFGSEDAAEAVDAEEPLPIPVKPVVYWTADEYKAIARELTPIYPRILTEGHMPGLTLTELNNAIRAALPAERHRRMANQAHIRSFGRRLRDALDGKPLWGANEFAQHGHIAAEALPDYRSGPRTLWNADEWDSLVRQLYLMSPQLEVRFDELTLSLLNEAASTMTRPRRFFAVSGARRHLDLARARVKANHPSIAAAPEPEPAPAPATAQEAEPALVEETVPAPAPAALPAPVAELADKMFGKITWTREEWLLVAEQLHRLHPVQNYPFGHSLVGLETEDVAFAQERVLPLERQRRHLKVASFNSIRPQLERAFADLRAKLEGKPLPARAEPVPKPAATAGEVAAVVHTAQAPAPAVAVAVAAPTLAQPAVDPYRAAFAPLVALLAGEVAAQLQPVLTQAIAQVHAAAEAAVQASREALAAQVATAVQEALYGKPHDPPHLAPVVAHLMPALAAVRTASEPAVNQAMLQAAPAKNYGDQKAPAEKLRRLTVGVLVNRQSTYKTELEKAFPMIEIRIGDVSMTHAADKIANCDKVICMTKWVDHVASIKLKKLAKDRYVDCNGGMSDLKRIIGIWLRAQGIVVAEVA